jgi:hypothetical protein
MRAVVRSFGGASEGAVAFLARLIRLQNEVREVGQQLDRIEAEMRHALNSVARERYEEYR